jgi:hypothetical protein
MTVPTRPTGRMSGATPAMSGLDITDVEIATGGITGTAAPLAHLDGHPGAEGPLAALERACLPALQAGPCLVSFSGGMDSTLVLAAALRAARREGLPDPVPVTWRFPGVPATDETDWQERILQRLGVRDRHVLTGADELDLVGPVATRMMRTLGTYYPANLHLHLPIADLATGGSILTGMGGDQMFLGPNVVARPGARRRAEWLPDPLRDRVRRSVGRDPYPWTTTRTSVAVQRAERAEAIRTVRAVGLADRLEWQLQRRYLAISAGDTARLGAATGVGIHHPLLDQDFLRAVLATFGDGPPPSRARMFEVMAQGCDPVVWTERPKAWFADVFLTDTARRYAAAWAARSATPPLPAGVKPAALKRAWSSGTFPPASALLLQWCRLHDRQD